MAPNSTGVRRTKRAPANSASRLGAASSSRSSVRSLTARMQPSATTNSAAATT